MSRHHALLTYWTDTAQPTDARTLTVADEDPVVVSDGIRDALRRFIGEAATVPMFPELAQDDDALWEDMTDAA